MTTRLLAVEWRGVPLWRWLIFWWFLAAVVAWLGLWFVALSAAPELSFPLTAVGLSGVYGAFIAGGFRNLGGPRCD